MLKKFYSLILLTAIALGIASCDSFKDEVVPAPAVELKANRSYFNLSADSIGVFDVLANDQFNVEIKVDIATPIHGKAQLEQGHFFVVYLPKEGYYGLDSLAYTISSGELQSTAWLVVNVMEGACVATANGDSATTLMNQTVSIPVLRNDILCGNETLSISQNANNGVATISNGEVSYRPDAGYIGFDNFQYRICVNGSCKTASVQVTIQPDPVCATTFAPQNDSITGSVSTAIIITKASLISNDISCTNDIDINSISSATSPSFGVLTEYPDRFEYIANQPGVTSFTYRVCSKSHSSVCKTATVTLAIH